jgi:adenylate cyclase
VCNLCEQFALEHPGGAEIELAMIFADVRGSTPLAERMGAAEFGRLIDRFYSTASRVFIRNDGVIEKLIGDAATALFFPGFAGEDYARRAIDAARELLAETGHPDEPWIPIGVGVHAGTAYVGAVGAREGRVEMAALGDAMNTGARLSSSAAAGEILASDYVVRRAGLDATAFEARSLQLKGKTEPVAVRVLTVDQPAQVQTPNTGGPMPDPTASPSARPPSPPAAGAAWARLAGVAALTGAILMAAGAFLWTRSGTDLDAAVAGGQIGEYLRAAGAATAVLTANLTLWILGVLAMGAAGLGFERLSTRRPVTARLGLWPFVVGVPLALSAFVVMLALVAHAGDAGAERLAAAELLGWYASRADWTATVLIVGAGPLLASLAGRGHWVPGWLLGLGAAAGAAGALTVVAMFAGGLSTYGFAVVPIGLLWMLGAGVTLLRVG